MTLVWVRVPGRVPAVIWENLSPPARAIAARRFRERLRSPIEGRHGYIVRANDAEIVAWASGALRLSRDDEKELGRVVRDSFVILPERHDRFPWLRAVGGFGVALSAAGFLVTSYVDRVPVTVFEIVGAVMVAILGFGLFDEALLRYPMSRRTRVA